MYRILLVEDDLSIASQVQKQLSAWGFEVRAAEDFTAILADVAAFDPQLVLLDISLPYYNGFYWCGEIRKTSRVPILFLSSHTESMDIIMAMNMGGDDYITKPFPMEVLIAKVNALLRRTYDYAQGDTPLGARGALLHTADATLRTDTAEIPLTRNESRILHTLLLYKNQIVPRETLMKALWDDDNFIDDNTLTVNINRLRKKLSEAGLAEYILTKKGLGYMVHD